MHGPDKIQPVPVAIEEEPAFGVLLRRHRRAAGLTQDELAERAGLSTRAIASLECGARRAPYLNTVHRLSAALQLGDEERANLRATVRRVSVSAPEILPKKHPGLWAAMPISSFVGRDREIAEIHRLLGTTRLLTLVGPGGMGKTRLALEVLARVAVNVAQDGVAFVDLAPLVDPAVVAQAVAAVLGVLEQPGRPPLEVLANAVGTRPLLLVLDNCEHLIGVCADLVEALLRVCPGLQILATSRETLRVGGETTWHAPPLAVPHQSTIATPECLARFGSVQLFVGRANSIRPEFALDERNMLAVVDVCRRLDGMPLAIELAAAKVAMLSVEEIGAHLEDRFRLLADGSRTAPPRQQTLHATLDWSYVLLSVPERRMFERLSVFAGGFSLDALARVCAGEDVAESDVLDLLTHLVHKSLVVAEPCAGTITHYRLLETLRAFAHERLLDSGRAETTRHKHAAFFLALAERAEPELDSAHRLPWIERLEGNHDNLRAALRFLLERGVLNEAYRLGAALWCFWAYHGHVREGRAWMAKILALPGGEHQASRVRVLDGAGVFAWQQSDTAAAEALQHEALALARERGDQDGMGFALAHLADSARVCGRYPAARGLLHEALAVSRATGNQRLQGWCMGGRQILAAAEGDFTTVLALGEPTLALFRATGSERGLAQTLKNLGRAHLHLGDDVAARPLLEEALARARALGDIGVIVGSLTWLGELELDEGELARAEMMLGESLALTRDLGSRLRIQCLEIVAKLAVAQARPQRAVRLAGATAALRVATAHPLSHSEQANLERWLAPARASLAPEVAAAAWSLGQQLSLDEATHIALDAETSRPWCTGV